MNFTETIKKGQYYRVFDKLNNDGTRHYNRYSFVTNASDVIFEDGSSAEDKLGGSSGSLAAINEEIAALKKSVSDGKKAVADAVTANGVTTATDAAFSVIASNIDIMAKNKYDAGIVYADSRVNTNSANYKSGYGTGHTEGYKEGQNSRQIISVRFDIIGAYNHPSNVTYSTYEESDGDICSKFDISLPPNTFACIRFRGKSGGYTDENAIYMVEHGTDVLTLSGPNWHKDDFESEEPVKLEVEYWYLPE